MEQAKFEVNPLSGRSGKRQYLGCATGARLLMSLEKQILSEIDLLSGRREVLRVRGSQLIG